MTFKDKPRRPPAGKAARGGPSKTRKPGPRKDAAPEEKRAPRPAQAEVETGVAAGKPERISKLLARAGIASRRDVERMIMEGRVSLNGKVLDTPVVNATFADTIAVDGEPIRGVERTRLWLYHKPAGLVTTNADPEGRSTVFDNLPGDLPRVMSIGRLDINTEGLLLLTNDGGLARVLELPTTGWLRRYRVRAHGDVDQEALDKLKEGIAVDGVLYGAIDATLDRKQGHNVWITMGLREGKNREIKNVLGALGLDVNRLIRISYGPFQLGDLDEGKVLEVRGRMLRDQLGPRLIEDAKANFDAPIYNAPVGEDEEDAKPKAAPAKSTGWDKPKRARDYDPREEARDRLDTRKGPGPKSFGGKDDRKGGDRKGGFKKKFGDDDRRGGFAADKRDGGKRDGEKREDDKRKPFGTSRTANVWMAPGARPMGEKKAAKVAARPNRPERDERPAVRPNELRVTVARARDEDGEWIRAEGPDKKSGPPRRSRDEGGFGERRDRGGDDRSYHGGGGRSDETGRGERTARGPRGGKPFGEGRSFEGRSGDGRSGEGRPGEGRGGDKPYAKKPGGKPFGGKPGGRGGSSRPAPTRNGPPKGKR
ncbi:pseudouridine synthase [Rhizobium halophytocola]|uniref:Pseudouridine synthase n=1 Tax=Rhizobium halophytocola TaxID=735519 RepID=A0ABS4DXN6_9HYPH|nr:pseudouridine synthase [Rhizobium halophytocola]MBP1850451.1 23S rRNA pseudouridine2605 synthase [Rhizobium halophytocola]